MDERDVRIVIGDHWQSKRNHFRRVVVVGFDATRDDSPWVCVRTVKRRSHQPHTRWVTKGVLARNYQPVVAP